MLNCWLSGAQHEVSFFGWAGLILNAEESVGGIVLVERKKEPADRRATI